MTVLGLFTAAVLLLAPWLGVWAELSSRRGFGWREGLAVATVAWALYAVLLVELDSLATGNDPSSPKYDFPGLEFLWVGWLPAMILGVELLKRNRGVWVAGLGTLREQWSRADNLVRACTAACVAIGLLVGVVALVAAPNNWDSMTYHLMRVEQWMRLGGVAHYATHYEPQLYQPPGAEMLILTGRSISGSDQLAGAVQWLAFLIAMPVASLAAARLGAAVRGQALAALLVATTPMALMQASSTQNDLLLGLWLLIAATLAVGLVQETKAPGGGPWLWAPVAAVAGALALAVLTKGTALVFGLPVGLLLVWALVRSMGWRRAAAATAAVLLVVMTVNAGQWLRNHQTYGAFISAGSGPNQYVNDSFGPATLVSNLVRNASNHLDMPAGAVNNATRDAITGALEAVGIDPNDPATTFTGQQFEVGPFGPHEDHAGNLALLLLGVWAVVAVLAVAAWRRPDRTAWAVMLIGQVLLFTLVFKWQNWHARLHLPAFVLVAPLVAVCLGELRRRTLANTVAALLLLAAPLYVFYNYTRPLVGERSVLTTARQTQYFLPRPNLEAPYRALDEELDRRIAFKLAVVAPIDQWEYPIYALREDGTMDVYDALVENPSAKYGAPVTDAEHVACISCDARRRAQLKQAGFVAAPLEIGPVKHDSRLTETPVTVELWVRRR
jgi:hypothetical protein